MKRQDPVTGAFAGTVSENGLKDKPVQGASVEIVNIQTGAKYRRVTDVAGGFYVGRLSPGVYRITVSRDGFESNSFEQRLLISQVNTVQPVPVDLKPLTVAPSPIITTGPTPPPDVAATTPTPPSTSPTPDTTPDEERVNLQVGRLDGRRGGGYNEDQVATLPLGAATYVRTFDELALLLPGVTLPPFSVGSIAGPGVAPGVGTPGQFSVNGLPPRANNFTVDGSDNNDEDIGVRRQGFFTLVPQSVESIKEYQVITLLAPAQFGRNIGAQVNAVSKSGGNDVHGDLYGLFNSSALNARGFFDTEGPGGTAPLTTAGGRAVILCAVNTNCTTGTPINVDRSFGGEDASTLGQFGFTLGGPIKKERWFYFLSGERQVLNASQEQSFAVPSVEQRGFGLAEGQTVFNPLDPRSGSGATGFTQDPLSLNSLGARATPQTLFGAAIFSLFPFPNNPTGVYGANTYTQVLPASGKGTVASGKLDYVNTERRFFQSFTARYNFTQDWRDIPAAGGAIFAALRPATRTQNISSFLNSELSGPDASTQVYNQVRFSYGRTRLRFDELRDPSLLGSNFGGFLLNRPLLRDVAGFPTPPATTTDVPFSPIQLASSACVAGTATGTTECLTGPVGQVIIGGFSPVGVDVYNFPQRRVNNTYQLADTMSIRESGPFAITYTFGTDIRRSELNSALPRNSRPLITFFGSTSLQNNPANPPSGCGGVCEVDPNRIPYIPATWLAAAGVPSGFFQSLAAPGREDGQIRLRYYQYNFFGQEDFRLGNTLSITLGLRYEYNTPVKEVGGLIEQFYGLAPALNPLGILAQRDSIYDPDRNNIAPRAGFAWAPNIFGAEHPSVIRAGFGVYYDQILGSVASQSRNVFPGFLPLNVAATNSTLGLPFALPRNLTLGNISNSLVPVGSRLGPCIVEIFGSACIPTGVSLFAGGNGNLNTFNPIFDPNSGSFSAQQLGNLIAALRFDLPSSFAFTLPSTRLSMPMAYHYSYTIEQGLPHNMLVSAGYVGTKGRNLIRITTPNGGPNNFPIIGTINTSGFTPGVNGAGIRNNSVQTPNRVNAFLGALNIIETTGRSQYDAFQAQLRGRLSRTRPFLYQVGYTFSRSRDSVSDVFDLAGAPALPQQSTTFSGNQTLSLTGGNFPGEYARSNYDTPHRVVYDLVWDLFPGRNGLQLASTGMFQSGQPFTVNSIIDVNKDGNLTDRLNTTAGLTLNGSDRSPIVLATGSSGETLTCAVGTTTRALPVSGSNTRSLLACQGFNAALARNTFRAGAFRIVNLTAIKKFSLGEATTLSARLDVFNLLDRDNFNIPVRILESPGFGSATETVTPGRRLQFGLKLTF
ncbi:MAG TPA: carboxypeptidase-like regulatory domain-containing protein [Pyrinomonadaceae bacterium]